MTCSVNGCHTKALKRGMCNKHYLRWWKHGDPLAGGTEKGAAQSFYRDTVIGYAGSECLIWPFAREEHGYGIMNSGGRCQIVSRMVCEDVHGAPPTPEHEAAHSCGNGHEGCVSQNHLRWATFQENREDMIAHGRSQRGEANYFSVLSATEVREIRQLIGSASQRAIAAKFGVTQSAIQSIASGKSWAWME